MSFLPGFGRPQPSSAEKIANAEVEMDMISDMMSRLNQSCVKKCIQPDYREADLTKGESVCLDRCVGKFFDVQMKVSEKMQGDAAMKQGQMGM
ncbi:MAG: hypothetical protein L6R42_003364 [Xanthoria sp. 1 TBL-2021]|nr:MAG: hypothetical protein L6R42_003364 [Xanthoria sp. 1 TBL-2021]